MSATPSDTSIASIQRIALITGIAGCVLALLGLVIPGCTPHVFRGWLVGFNLFTGAAVGPLAIIMIQYLTGGNWGLMLRPTLEAASRTLPLMALLFLPIVFGMDYVYEWSRFEKVHHHPELVDQPLYAGIEPHDHELEHKLPMLNQMFFFVRVVVYFGIWGTLAYLLNRWSAELEQKHDKSILDRCASLSAPGLVIYVLTVSFASIDFAMSLEPKWYSTIYGAMFGMGQVLTAFAIAVATITLLSYRTEILKAIQGQTMSDMGTLLGAFIILWAYLSFMQFLIIWMGQIPEELPWYVARMMTPPWRYVAIALVLLHFAVPFAMLSTINVKRNRRLLAGVALFVCAMRVIDLVWLIVPSFDQNEKAFVASVPLFAYLVYAGAIVGIGGLWLATFLWQLSSRPMLPSYIPEGGAHGETAHA